MGGKNKNSATDSGSSIEQSSSSTVPPPQTPPPTCETPVKHWIGVRVEDEDGKVAKVSIHCKLPDASFDVDMDGAVLDSTGVFKTDKLYAAGNCDFSIPAVYDVEWWPKGGTAPASFPDEQGASLEAGDCVETGSFKAGFRNYHSVWDCAGNSDLKTNHPNPNQQSVGTALRGPAQKSKIETKAVDQSWTFVVRSIKPPMLQIVLVDKDDKPLSGKSWELAALGATGTTAADGKIKVTSDKLLKLNADTLKVVMKAPQTPPTPTVAPPVTPTVAPPVTPTDPPAYPPPIAAADFKDKVPDPDYTAQTVKWSLEVGAMEPFNVHTGALERLHNLGFSCATGLAGQSTAVGEARAIKAYNLLYTKTATTWDDIKEDLRDRHEKP
jgi:hypothetical protein